MVFLMLPTHFGKEPKIKCGRKHFEALEVDFDVVTSVDDIK